MSKDKKTDKVPYLMVGVSAILVASAIFAVNLKEEEPQEIHVLEKVDIVLKRIEDSPPTTPLIEHAVKTKPFINLNKEEKRVAEDKEYKTNAPTSFKQHFINLGFSESGANKMLIKNPKVTLNLDDFGSDDERAAIRREIADWKHKGYKDISLREINRIYDAPDKIYDYSPDYTNLNFRASSLPDKLVDEFIYTGRYLPEYDKKGIEQGGELYETPFLYRVFSRPDGAYVFMQEEGIKDGYSGKIDGYVTNHVQGYPLTFTKVKHENGTREAWQAEFSTKEYSYTINLVGITDKVEAQKELLEIADGLAILNSK